MGDSPEYKKALQAFGDETYYGDEPTQAEIDRALKKHGFDEITDRWYADRRAAWDEAISKFYARVAAEAKLLRDKRDEKVRGEKEKLAEKQRNEQEKLAEKQRKLDEEERVLMEHEQAEWDKIQPRAIPDKIRLEHVHVLGPSGSGKTTLLQNQIIWDYFLDESDENDYYKVNPNPPAYVVIDPKGLMVERLSKPIVLSKHLVIVDPFDAPALNLFQKTGRNPAQLISDFRYIFSTTNQKMTGKQAPCFSFCAQLLFTIEGSTLFTLLDLLDDGTNKKPRSGFFQHAASLLPPVAKRFFQTDFYGANYASTREEIKARIWGVLENDTLSKMFNASTRKLNMDKYIRERKIVLVNTRMTQLKEAHQTFGRYIIALTKDAILSRKETHPVYLVIDEFQEFADPQKTPELLRLIREYNGGAVLAHQNMYCAELDDDTRNAISTNTSIKYASSPEAKDSRYMAGDMRCTEEFLMAQHKTDTHAKFACFVRGMHPPLQHPFVVQSEFGWLEKWPKMTDDAYKALRARNKAALQDDKVPEPKTHEAAPAGTAPKPAPSEAPVAVRLDPPIIAQHSDPSKPAKWVRK